MNMRMKYVLALSAVAMIAWGNVGSYQSMKRALKKGYRKQEAEMMADCEDLTVVEYPFIMPGRTLAKIMYER